MQEKTSYYFLVLCFYYDLMVLAITSIAFPIYIAKTKRNSKDCCLGYNRQRTANMTHHRMICIDFFAEEHDLVFDIAYSENARSLLLSHNAPHDI